MPKVFIINDGGHDYSSAKIFGELVIVTTGKINRFHITRLKRMFAEFFSKSTVDDYILFGGPSMVAAIACSVFARKHGRLNLLLWMPDDELGGTYVCRKTMI